MIHISADEKSKKKEDQRKRDRRAEEKEGQRKRERGTEEKEDQRKRERGTEEKEDQRRRERRTEEKGDQRKRGGRHVDNQKSKDKGKDKGASSKISPGDEPDLHDVLMNARDDLEPANKRIRPDDMTCTNLDEEDKVRII